MKHLSRSTQKTEYTPVGWLFICGYCFFFFLTERNECKDFLVSVEELKLSKWNNMAI